MKNETAPIENVFAMCKNVMKSIEDFADRNPDDTETIERIVNGMSVMQKMAFISIIASAMTADMTLSLIHI